MRLKFLKVAIAGLFLGSLAGSSQGQQPAPEKKTAETFSIEARPLEAKEEDRSMEGQKTPAEILTTEKIGQGLGSPLDALVLIVTTATYYTGIAVDSAGLTERLFPDNDRKTYAGPVVLCVIPKGTKIRVGGEVSLYFADSEKKRNGMEPVKKVEGVMFCRDPYTGVAGFRPKNAPIPKVLDLKSPTWKGGLGIYSLKAWNPEIKPLHVEYAGDELRQAKIRLNELDEESLELRSQKDKTAAQKERIKQITAEVGNLRPGVMFEMVGDRAELRVSLRKEAMPEPGQGKELPDKDAVREALKAIYEIPQYSFLFLDESSSYCALGRSEPGRKNIELYQAQKVNRIMPGIFLDAPIFLAVEKKDGIDHLKLTLNPPWVSPGSFWMYSQIAILPVAEAAAPLEKGKSILTPEMAASKRAVDVNFGVGSVVPEGKVYGPLFQYFPLAAGQAEQRFVGQFSGYLEGLKYVYGHPFYFTVKPGADPAIELEPHPYVRLIPAAELWGGEAKPAVNKVSY